MATNRFASFSDFDDLFAPAADRPAGDGDRARAQPSEQPAFDALFEAVGEPLFDAGAPRADRSAGPDQDPAPRGRVVRPSPATPGVPAGVPFPGTAAAAPTRLPMGWRGKWVTVFVPDPEQLVYAQVLSVDLAIGRIVAQSATEVVELDLTPETQFYLGEGSDRVHLDGEHGALVADRLLDLLATAPRPITAREIMRQALAVLHPQEKRGWFGR